MGVFFIRFLCFEFSHHQAFYGNVDQSELKQQQLEILDGSGHLGAEQKLPRKLTLQLQGIDHCNFVCILGQKA
jgi:hypothetical protein